MQIRLLSDLIQDERDNIISYTQERHDIDGEFTIAHIERNMKASATKYLKRLNAPITRYVGNLDSDTKHILLSELFGRKIVSSKAVTNVEVLAMEHVLQSVGYHSLTEAAKDLFNGR